MIRVLRSAAIRVTGVLAIIAVSGMCGFVLGLSASLS